MKPRWLNSLPLPYFAAAGDTAGGGGASDTAKAGGADDTAKGGGGDDTAKGGGGDNTLPGALGNDTIKSSGDDTQKGGDFDWRAEAAGDDEEVKGELGRFKSLKDVGKALVEQKKRLRKGVDLGEEMPDEAKDPEGAKEWRKARGVPEKAEDYTLSDGIKKSMTDDDKPLVDAYLTQMHKQGASQREITRGLETYFQLQGSIAADQAEADKQMASETQETLRGQWGSDYSANKKIAGRAAVERIDGVNGYGARLPDGRLLANIPEVADFLLDQGFKKFGEGAYEHAEGGSGKGVDAEFADLKEQMKDKKAWTQNKKGQARYMELLDQQARRKGRVADAE